MADQSTPEPDYDAGEHVVLSDAAWEAWERALREAKAAYESERR